MDQINTQYIRRVPFNELRHHFPGISDIGLKIISGLTADLPSTQTMATNAQGSAAAATNTANSAETAANTASTNASNALTASQTNATNIAALQSSVTALQNDLTALRNDVMTPSGTASPQNTVTATRTQIYIQTGAPAAIWYNPTIGANTGWVQIV